MIQLIQREKDQRCDLRITTDTTYGKLQYTNYSQLDILNELVWALTFQIKEPDTPRKEPDTPKCEEKNEEVSKPFNWDFYKYNIYMMVLTLRYVPHVFPLCTL